MIEKYIPLYLLVFFSTLLITVISERRLIPFLSKRAQQPLYEEGPAWHANKKGTPTMGGLGFASAAAISLFCASAFLLSAGQRQTALSLICTTFFAMANGAIGIIDDITKLKRKKNAGLSPSQKLLLQTVCAVLFLTARRYLVGDTTVLRFAFADVDIGPLYYPLAISAIIGSVNAANLTDGIDGLASSVAFAIGASLLFMTARTEFTAALLASTIIGASLGFLVFNINPAKIFMGDTGSLFFGAITVGCAFAMKNPLIMIFVGGVYLVEGASVILQVLFYKATGKRIFKMAPLHHHLEKCGMGENKICLIAVILTLLLSLPALLIFVR
jgi:phospho-N-acetylmuramoyl-pentapeptide-transferase